MIPLETESTFLQVKNMESGNEEVVSLAELSDNLQQKVKALADQPFDLVAKKRQAPAAEQSSSSQPSASAPQSASYSSQSGASTTGAASSGRAANDSPQQLGQQQLTQQQQDGGLKGLKAMVNGDDMPGVVQNATQSLAKLGIGEDDRDRK